MSIALIDIFAKRFFNRLDVVDEQVVFYSYKYRKIIFMYKPVWVPVTRKVICAHLKGEKTFGIPALSADGYSKWLLFDDDTNSGETEKLHKFLTENNWHFIHEGRREGRAGHTWLLFDKPVAASQLRILGSEMLRLSGANISETFPKQDFIKSKNGIGNVVKLPLGIHRKPGADNCRGLFEDCSERDIKSQLIWLLAQPLNHSEIAIKLAEQHRPMLRPIYLKQHDYSGDRIDFLKYAQEQGFVEDGDYLRGPCPNCVVNGHDADSNHMWIHIESGYADCWLCGKEGFGNIVTAIKQGTNNSATK